MKDSWATSGLDLHLDVGGTRPRVKLERALRDAVQSGQLTPGSRLPSSRSLARDLGIARNTVAEAYQQLTAEGWFSARQGSGTQVADRAVPDDTGAASVSRQGSAQPRLDLRPGRPDVSSFPRTQWLAAAHRAVVTAPNEVFDYGDPRGLPRLRHVLASYAARTRGVRTSPDRIVVCSGFGQALSLLATILRDAGAPGVAVEAFGHPFYPETLMAVGLDLTPVPVDGRGALTSALESSLVDAALLTPAHQFPIGVALHPERREIAVEWARDNDALIIEDDYDGEFRYDRRPLGALQALDPTRVVYVGTTSKTLAPGLRLAWMAVPSSLLDAVVTAKRLADHNTGVIGQLTLAEFVESGRYDQHIRRARLKYRRRRDRLVEVLAERAPSVRVTGISAGLHAVLELSEHAGAGGSADDVENYIVTRAAAYGLAVVPLHEFRFRPEGDGAGRPPALVVGYGTASDSSFGPALDALCAALA